jgi:hypothetical protein
MPAIPEFQPFRPEDFRLYEPQNRSDDALNARRLEVRHKLQFIGDTLKKRLAAESLRLERRESLHHPFSVNHMRVVAQWTALFRDARARKEFARFVGPDLGKDVDPGNANLAFFVTIDEGGLAFGLRWSAEAWYDAQNFVNKYSKSDERRRELADLLKQAPSFHARIHDWATLYPCSRASRENLEEIIKYFRVGEHRLSVAQHVAKDDPAACSADFCGRAVGELAQLAPVYKALAWSPANNFLLSSGGGFQKS